MAALRRLTPLFSSKMSDAHGACLDEQDLKGCIEVLFGELLEVQRLTSSFRVQEIMVEFTLGALRSS